jgi:hypothetical protein
MTSLSQLYGHAIDLATNPKHTRWQSLVLLAFDALLCGVIILKVPCRFLFPFPHLVVTLKFVT